MIMLVEELDWDGEGYHKPEPLQETGGQTTLDVDQEFIRCSTQVDR
jgi:hypothetical protein